MNDFLTDEELDEMVMYAVAGSRTDKMARELLERRRADDLRTQGRVKVPEGQTPLNDKLGHRFLDVIAEGMKARDAGTGSPYHGHSLEHCLHAAGWVQRDLRLALDACENADDSLYGDAPCKKCGTGKKGLISCACGADDWTVPAHNRCPE